MATKKEIRSLVGQLFVVGFNGYSVPEAVKKFAAEFTLGGIIYFKRNVQSPGQLAELSNDLQSTCRKPDEPPLLICIDHEGGKVNRLVKPFTKFPGNESLGELNSPKIGFEFGMVLGKELKAVGINVNFAPVVDVLTNTENTVIRNRSFSSDPLVCAKLGSAVARGIQKMGVMAVAKHFPGHGDVKEDSHHLLPKLKRSLKGLRKLELIPFQRVIRSRIGGIMTGHLLNTALDADYPATLSEKTLKKVLRDELRFDKIIFSDDMEMKAITKHYGDTEAAVLAVKAGCDMLIYRAETELPIKPAEAILKAVEKKKIPLSALKEAVKRVKEGKLTFGDPKKLIEVTEVGKFIGLPEHFQLADIITKKEIPVEEL